MKTLIKDFFNRSKETGVVEATIEVLTPSKTYTVEEIHEAFDSAQDRILDETDKLLAELKIPTETKVENKAKMLEKLGFVNSEPVKQYSIFKKNQQEIKQKVDITRQQAESIRYFAQKYPLEKFITVDELDRICNKYGLIHAPVKNYIKDIPEKNVLEITNIKKLDFQDSSGIFNDDKNLKGEFLKLYSRYFTSPNTYEFHLEDVIMRNYISLKLKPIPTENEISTNSIWLRDTPRFSSNSRVITPESAYGTYINNAFQYGGNKIDKSSLFIAAPQSHFDLKGLDKKSKYGYFTVTKVKVKDPVVFEYCKDNLVRIISKWGTDDDQSYLDETLINEKYN